MGLHCDTTVCDAGNSRPLTEPTSRFMLRVYDTWESWDGKVSLRKSRHDWEVINYQDGVPMFRYYPASNNGWPYYGEEMAIRYGYTSESSVMRINGFTHTPDEL